MISLKLAYFTAQDLILGDKQGYDEQLQYKS